MEADRRKAWRREAMTKPPVSEEMLNAFIDRQLAPDDRLRVLQTIASDHDHGLVQEICERQRVKELVGMAYPQPARPARALRNCGLLTWRWWRR
jgi:anti-sigma factor RsiW